MIERIQLIGSVITDHWIYMHLKPKRRAHFQLAKCLEMLILQHIYGF